MPAIQLNETLLDEKLSALESVRSWSPRVISKLETLIRTGDDYSLFRISPLQHAAERNMSNSEALDLFIYAARYGLFEMEWHLVCPSCGHVVESFKELQRLHSHFVCQSCFVVKEAQFDDYIQVSFTISPLIRRITFHSPETLSAEDLFLRYHIARGIRPSADAFIQGALSITRMIQYLPAGETYTLELDLIPDVLLFREYSKDPQVLFQVSPEIASTFQEVHLRLVENRCESVSHPTVPQEFSIGGFHRRFPQLGSLRSGKAVLKIENRTDKPAPIWVLNFAVNNDQPELEFEHFISGKMLLTNQTFRTLFRTETVQADEGIGIKDITFLFTDLKGSTAMYDAVGDPKAYFLVRQHFDTLGRVIAQHSGAIVKTIGDAVMATFMNPVDALNAALAMIREMREFNRTISTPLHLKIGIHQGHSIVVTLNERLDYFGQTVNIAARVQGLADADEIYLTQEAYQNPGMSQVLKTYDVLPQQVEVKGVSDRLNVYRLTLI